jgi:hypothetical protein
MDEFLMICMREVGSKNQADIQLGSEICGLRLGRVNWTNRGPVGWKARGRIDGTVFLALCSSDVLRTDRVSSSSLRRHPATFAAGSIC